MKQLTNKDLKIGVSNSVLDAKQVFQNEVTNLMKHLNLKLNESLVYDALNLSETEKSNLSKERFQAMSSTIKNYKKELGSTIKSSTKPYKDIFNQLKKELIDWETSISKTLNQAGHNIHSIGILKGYEDLSVGFRAGANIEPVIESIDLSQINPQVLEALVGEHAKHVIKQELKQGRGIPELQGIKYKLVIPDANNHTHEINNFDFEEETELD